jgi:hypothetical protein
MKKLPAMCSVRNTNYCDAPFRDVLQDPERIEYYKEAHVSLLFGSNETSPIKLLGLGKPAPAIQCWLRVER